MKKTYTKISAQLVKTEDVVTTSAGYTVSNQIFKGDAVSWEDFLKEDDV